MDHKVIDTQLAYHDMDRQLQTVQLSSEQCHSMQMHSQACKHRFKFRYKLDLLHVSAMQFWVPVTQKIHKGVPTTLCFKMGHTHFNLQRGILDPISLYTWKLAVILHTKDSRFKLLHAIPIYHFGAVHKDCHVKNGHF